MQWVQTNRVEGSYRSSVIFKCNGCGATAQSGLDAGVEKPLPADWQPGPHEGWHFCPRCEKPKRAALPVV